MDASSINAWTSKLGRRLSRWPSTKLLQRTVRNPPGLVKLLKCFDVDAQAQSQSVEDYLTAVESNATKFLEGDEFFDRAQLVASGFKSCYSAPKGAGPAGPTGRFGLLGGKSTGLFDIISFISILYLGKSFLLKHLQLTLLDKKT
jgi:hypothetical protein